VSAQSFLEKQIMYQLGRFLENMGLHVIVNTHGNEEFLYVVDDRVKDLKVDYTFKVVEDGKKMCVESFSVHTKSLTISKNDKLDFTFHDEKTGDPLIIISFRKTSDLVFPLEDLFLKYLVERPAYFLVHRELSDKFLSGMPLLDTIIDDLWIKEVELNEEQRKTLRDFLNSLNKSS
jgi:hypothetical protein